jgi:hypothetical protein
MSYDQFKALQSFSRCKRSGSNMAYPAKSFWPRTLADQHGVWCAWCLKYIRPIEFQEEVLPSKLRLEWHHVHPKTSIRKRFGERFPRGWTVPAHSRDCHQPTLQTFAFATDAYLQYLEHAPFDLADYHSRASRSQNRDPYLRSLQFVPLDDETRDRQAQRLHDEGYYWLSALVKETIIRDILKRQGYRHSEASDRVIEYQIASAAGIRHRLPSRFSKEKLPDRPLLILNQANLEANRGNRELAMQLFKHAKELLHGRFLKQSDSFRLPLLLRSAQIDRHPESADRAVRESDRSPYSHKTALILAGFVHLESGTQQSLNRAESCFQEVLQSANVSWLYRAESYFGLASIALKKSRPTTTAFKLLEAAQYIYLMLGLQGTPHPLIHLSTSGSGACPMPGDVLMNCADFAPSKLKKKTCLMLRREAIYETDLQTRLLGTLCGFK